MKKRKRGDDPNEWRLQCQKLRRITGRSTRGDDQGVWEQMRFETALRALGFKPRPQQGAALPPPPSLLEVWDSYITLSQRYVTHSLATKESLPAAEVREFNELAAAVFPPLILSVLEFWGDPSRDLSALYIDVCNVFLNFVDKNYMSGVAPLVVALLPFDAKGYVQDPWFRRVCKQLATGLEDGARGLISTECLADRSRRLAAFHCRPCPRNNVVMFTKPKEYSREQHSLLTRPQLREESPPDVVGVVFGGGVTRISELEGLVLACLAPRELRACEVCRRGLFVKCFFPLKYTPRGSKPAECQCLPSGVCSVTL